MAIAIDVLNFEYDDAEPAFVQRDGYYLHLKTHMEYDKPSFAKWMKAQGLTFGPLEIAPPSDNYVHEHSWQGLLYTAPSTIMMLDSITASVTKTPTVKNNDTGEITFAGGPSDDPYTVTLTIRDAASGGDDVQNVAIAKYDTVGTVAAKVAAAVSDPNVKATASGAVVTFKPKAGSHFTKLTVSIA